MLPDGSYGPYPISIHALREEGDRYNNRMPRRAGDFYPRPPRGGRPGLNLPAVLINHISIHALREEGDDSQGRSGPYPAYFYPRPPRGGRLVGFEVCSQPLHISIHALREEGDWIWCASWGLFLQFLSTPSARRATALHLEHYPVKWNFYPRPPRGGRQAAGDGAGLPGQFLSTPSARRATCSASRGRAGTAYFYPRPPRGGRLVYALHAADMRAISIHALREEGDIFCV